MNETRYKPTLAAGAITGLLLTAPLMAWFYLAARLLGVAFPPFDLLDWLTRTLPGGIITFGIDLLVSVLAALNLSVSGTAKTAEHIMALVMFLLLGAVVGGALFAYFRRSDKADALAGLVAGGLVGAAAAIISGTLNQSATASPLVSMTLILVSFLVWGAAYGWMYNQLAARTGTVALRESAEAASVERLDRRSFLIRIGSAAAGFTVVGTGLGAILGTGGATLEGEGAVGARPWSADNPLPNAGAVLQPAPGTRPEFTPVSAHYRIDINALPPVIHEEDYRLRVIGLVDNPLELSLEDIREDYPAVEQFVTLSCISNPLGGELIGTQRWTGVPLKHIINAAVPHANAQHLHIRAADGFDEFVARSSINTDDRIMLAYAWDDLPLTTAHGFPLRIFIPDRYGMKQPKWITSIELVSTEDEGYWVRRGWDMLAQVRATSVIDTVAVDARYEENGQTFVPVGGIAFAGKRGISKVEVRVDDGDWQEAELRDPISDLTWVIWRYDYPFQPGEHTFYVRCVDKSGAQQIETPWDTHPSGATGIHRKRANL